jgi:nitrite reductase (NADH) small subunit
MEGFHKAAKFVDLTPARPLRLTIEDREIVLLMRQEAIFAVENLCPHQQFALFHQAVVDGTTLTCPMHGWSFDLRTGRAIAGSGRIKLFEVKVEAGDIFVKLPHSSNSIFD